uniref:Uncharacterized protein n=1 Tax=Aquisalinus luteolus TaxID=1566827 RepID=A0A8J3A4E4_9PROT|nr:hypothetical protein GCM10011355_20360 [Aquisalinus luteolus]
MESFPQKRKSPPVTKEMARQIKALYAQTDMTQHDIAAHFGINQGRISEVLNGHTFPKEPPAQLDLL